MSVDQTNQKNSAPNSQFVRAQDQNFDEKFQKSNFEPTKDPDPFLTGDYECTCVSGYYGDGTTCSDFDECGPVF